MQQLHGLDSAMVLGEMADFPLHIGALLIYKPAETLTFEAVQALLLKQMEHHLPMLKCKLETLPFIADKPYWVEDDGFQLDSHLQRFALPAPANWDEMHKMAAHFHAEPLNQQRPLWQAWYVEGLDHLQGVPKGSVGLLLKIHHAMADGKAAAQIFTALHTLSPEADAPLLADSQPQHNYDFSSPGLLRKYTRAYWQLVTAPMKLTGNLAGMALKTTKQLAVPKGDRPAHNKKPKPEQTVFNRMPDADRIVGHIRLPMTKLRHVEKATGATINDIALCVISGAMNDYLCDQCSLPEKDLIAGMPINIRTTEDDNTIGNRISFANLSLYNSITDPLKRLAAIHESTHVVKQHDNRRQAGSMLAMLDNLYPGVLIWLGRKVVTSGVLESISPINNTVITNVPGLRQPSYLCGAELTDYLGLGVLAPTVTLFQVVTSVPSHVNITYLSCHNSLKDPDAYHAALQNSWKDLQAAVAGSSS